MNEKVAKIESTTDAIRAGVGFGFDGAYSFALDMARMILKNAQTDADREAATLMLDFLSSQRDTAKAEFLACLKMDEVTPQ